MSVTMSNATMSRTVVGPGEVIVVEFDLTHTMNKKLTKMILSIGMSGTGIPGNVQSNVAASIDIAANQAKNTTVHYAVEIRSRAADDAAGLFAGLLSRSSRSRSGNFALYLSAWDSYNGSYDFTNATVAGAVIDRRCEPAVATLTAERATNGAPDDEGESLLATVKLSIQDQTWLSGMTCRLYYAQGTSVDISTASSIDLTSSIQAFLSGAVTFVVNAQTFSRGSEWALLVTFGDVEMTASGVCEVSVAFANMHLAGLATGGAAFGRFSSSTLNNPKLESEYPIYPYAGIEGVNNYAAGDALTGGHWLGSPIRRAVFTDTGVTSTGAVAVGTLAATPAVVLSVTGCYYRAADTMFRPLPYISYASINWATSAVVHDDGDVELYFGSSNTGSKDYVLVVDYVASV